MAPEIVNPIVRNESGLIIRDQDDGRRNAYVTFLAGDGDYVKGVIGLAKGLRKVRAAFPLVVAVLPDVPEEHRHLLVEQGCLLREIEPVLLAGGSGEESPFVRPYFAVNYCKLRLWKFVEYNKMIYMDADIQVFDNIDHLFDLPGGFFYGVVDCLCDLYGEPCPQRLQWPQELGREPPFYFNGGMFMFEPNINTYKEILSTLEITPPTPFAEQDFLNMFFRDILKPLPPIYNLLVAMLWRHPEVIDLDKVKVVHYCVAGSKPWRFTGKEENMDRADIKTLVRKWWDIYNEEALDFNCATVSGMTRGQKLPEAAVVVEYRSASSAA
ncbi:Glycosyl transferase, family 8 - glycogenin [Handroanthus impetiginosus]|uniref:Hexosyltransferase n=1 Tax=Handroanthus impetiginosus TaxID=429701 RepID=A0A2G9GSV2_9LAMI|nr:Glycosyl transferase, family 8 - glycogenin [Handroanthus impetiginosus]